MSKRAFALGAVLAVALSVPATVWALGATAERAGQPLVAAPYTTDGATSKTKTISESVTSCTAGASGSIKTVLSTSINKAATSPVIVTLAAAMHDSDGSPSVRVLFNGTFMLPGEVYWANNYRASSFTWHRGPVPPGTKNVSVQIYNIFGNASCVIGRTLTIDYT